jgi:phytoene synthase
MAAGGAVLNQLDESYAVCKRLARQSASNFYYSFLLLPRPKRRSMHALYAFLRRVDDLGDNDRCDMAARRQALLTLRAKLEAALAGEMTDPILTALADTVDCYQIPREYLTEAIDGVEMDLNDTCYETFEELVEYCDRVAAMVGLACLHIWGFRGPQALEPARHCGLAFQLTNILRDLKEDIGRGRIYLPREDLRRFNYTIENLKRLQVNDQFVELIRFEIARAERYYESAENLESLLERDGRRALRTMMATYRALLNKIKASPALVLQGRIRLRGWEKFRIVGEALLMAPRQRRRASPWEAVSS